MKSHAHTVGKLGQETAVVELEGSTTPQIKQRRRKLGGLCKPTHLVSTGLQTRIPPSHQTSLAHSAGHLRVLKIPLGFNKRGKEEQVYERMRRHKIKYHRDQRIRREGHFNL